MRLVFKFGLLPKRNVVPNIQPPTHAQVVTKDQSRGEENKARFYGEELLAPRLTPQVRGPPIVGYPRLHTRYIHSYPPYWRPFLRPQPVEAQCHGDRDPLIVGRGVAWSGLIWLRIGRGDGNLKM